MVYGNVALCLTAVTRCFHFWARCYNGLALLKKMGHQRHCPGPWRGRLPGVTHCPAGKSMPAIRPPWMSAAAFHGFSLWPLMPDCMWIGPFGSAERPVWQSDMGRFALQKGPFYNALVANVLRRCERRAEWHGCHPPTFTALQQWQGMATATICLARNWWL